MKIFEHLRKAVRNSARRFNPDVKSPPVCVLWCDGERQWRRVLPKLREWLPELLVLGGYDPRLRSGPAVWLRCVIAGEVKEVSLPEGGTPILYLPGVRRTDLSVTEKYPREDLAPLMELQYRGTFWAHPGSADWTVAAFLSSRRTGPGLEVSRDAKTKKAMLRALDRLLVQEVETLKDRSLDRSFFNDLLIDDPDRMLLLWLNDEDQFKEKLAPETEGASGTWEAFLDICKSRFDCDPEADGVLGVAGKLVRDEKEKWGSVWKRFCEAPANYPKLSKRISGVPMPETDLFSNIDTHGKWPQWNKQQEDALREALRNLGGDAEVREKLLDLEEKHGERRGLPWAQLKEAPLATVLEHLATLARHTENRLAGGTADDLMREYSQQGWQADDAVIQAWAGVEKEEDRRIVSGVIRSIYLPWLEKSARYLQEIAKENAYPTSSIQARQSTTNTVTRQNGECVLFVDGLRFDAARRLAKLLGEKQLRVVEGPKWAALPSVTATGKPLASPLPEKFCGTVLSADFAPCIAATEKPLRPDSFKKLLAAEGWICLGESNDRNDGEKNAWCEVGDIDHEGHALRSGLAGRIGTILREISERISGLLEAGWSKVRVVTDHGWLLVPGGLPKSELPKAVTETKWSRCAVLKEGASDPGQRLYPWFWNPNHHYVLADGVSCFKKGEEYAHGGLSLQECLILELCVTAGSGTERTSVPRFVDVKWRGLRCVAKIENGFPGLKLDVRTKPANPDSSVVAEIHSLKTGSELSELSVLVEHSDREGESVVLVLLDRDEKVVAQSCTVIGGQEL